MDLLCTITHLSHCVERAHGVTRVNMQIPHKNVPGSSCCQAKLLTLHYCTQKPNSILCVFFLKKCIKHNKYCQGFTVNNRSFVTIFKCYTNPKRPLVFWTGGRLYLFPLSYFLVTGVASEAGGESGGQTSVCSQVCHI